MPNQGLSDEEIKQYLAYFKWADQNLQPQGKAQPPSPPMAAARPDGEAMKADTAWPRIGQRGPIVIAAALAAIAPAASLACGACVEDKVAATYDHAVVERAAASGDVMVFCEVTGPLDAQHLKQAMRRVHGVRPQSVRVSAQPASHVVRRRSGRRAPRRTQWGPRSAAWCPALA